MEIISKVTLKGRFEKLPLGAIKPAGWLKDQLLIQANGMTGQLEEHWEDVGSDSAWLGGEGEGWERGPYYLDGLVPLAYLLDDHTLIKKAQKWLDWILSSQDAEGWFGPTKDRDWWSRMIVTKVLMQYQEATGDERVIPFLLHYAEYQLQHLPKRPLAEWGKYRAGENILVWQWLYQQTGAAFLLEVITLLQEQAFDWAGLYQDYPFRRYVTEFSHESHVVNVAMALKYYGLDYRLSGDSQQRELLDQALKQLMVYHGQLHGMVSGDEWLAGTHPSQGTELCSIVEYMYSMETLLAIFGDTTFGDRLERAAFNALPAAISRDWLAHQYDQQVNQICCDHSKRNWTENGDDANLFGLEPHFGCCTANMHQGWPKFVSSLWMQDQEGLVCQSISPCVVDNGEVKVTVASHYPFQHQALLKVASQVSTILKIRIPTWVDTVTLLKNEQSVEVNIQNGYLIIGQAAGYEQYQLSFASHVQQESRAQKAIGISYGPLLFALPIEEKWQVVKGTAPFFDWQVTPQSDWRIALSVNASYQVVINGMTSQQVFDSRHSPIEVRTTGWKAQNWQVENHSAGTPPYQVEVGEAQEIILVPYGGAKLRIAEFPTIDSRS